MSSAHNRNVMTIDVMPVVSEGDELVSLADVLQTRDKCFNEDELWALLLETCKALQGLHSSSEAFQLLFVTPDSIAFDSSGRVRFLENVPDEPEHLYVAPEYEAVGHSFKSHLYSLGVSTWYAAEYGSSQGGAASSRNAISEELNATIAEMTKDRYEERPELTKVARRCKQKMRGKDTREICKIHAILAGRMSRASSVVGRAITSTSMVTTSGLWDPGKWGGGANLKKVKSHLISVMQEETIDDVSSSDSGRNDGNVETVRKSGTALVEEGEEEEEEEKKQKTQTVVDEKSSTETKSGEDRFVSMETLLRQNDGNSIRLNFDETAAFCKEAVLALVRETTGKRDCSVGSVGADRVSLTESGKVLLASENTASESLADLTLSQSLVARLTGQLVRLLSPLVKNADVGDDRSDAEDREKVMALFDSVIDEKEASSSPKLTDVLRLFNEIVYKRGVNSSFVCEELAKKCLNSSFRVQNGDSVDCKPTEIKTFEKGAVDTPSPKTLHSSFDSSSMKSFIQNEKASKSPSPEATKDAPAPKAKDFVSILTQDTRHQPVLGASGAFKPVSKSISKSIIVLPSKPSVPVSEASSVPKEETKSASASMSSLQYPEAYQSKLTHFKPIVVVKQDQAVVDKTKDKNKLNLNLLELKKNILKKHSQRNSWSEAIENDANENDASELSLKRETLRQKIQGEKDGVRNEKKDGVAGGVSHVSKFVGSKALRIGEFQILAVFLVPLYLMLLL